MTDITHSDNVSEYPVKKDTFPPIMESPDIQIIDNETNAAMSGYHLNTPSPIQPKEVITRASIALEKTKGNEIQDQDENMNQDFDYGENSAHFYENHSVNDSNEFQIPKKTFKRKAHDSDSVENLLPTTNK